MAHHRDKHSEQGFALYLAIGFIVLISLLAGSVGTRLNIAALDEARQNDQRRALDDAEASLGTSLGHLSTQFALDNTWPASASSATDTDVVADRDNCLAAMKPTQPVFTPRRGPAMATAHGVFCQTRWQQLSGLWLRL